MERVEKGYFETAGYLRRLLEMRKGLLSDLQRINDLMERIVWDIDDQEFRQIVDEVD